MPEFFHVASTSDIPDPGKSLVEVDGEMIALFHVAESFYAIDDVCTHDGGPLVDLGLIYNVSFSAAPDNSKQNVSIDMTMTSPACPAGPQLIADTKRAVNTHEDVEEVEVRIVMEPPWTPDRMTDDGRDQLGIF